MKVLLLFPPHWTPTMPHLALPALTAYLRTHGVEVVQRDLNVEVFDRILTRGYLEQALDHLRQDWGPGGDRQPARKTPPRRETVLWALSHGPQLAAQLEEAVEVVRSQAFLDGPRGLQAFLVMDQCLELASLPFYPASLGLLTYTPPSPADSSRSLSRAARDARYNLFLDLFRHGVIPEIARDPPDIVGISIATLEQMLAGMTLGHLIKEAGLPSHVTVGGAHISMLREQIPRVPAVWDCFDSAIVFEGERPLLRLAEALAGERDLSKVPNLIYKDQSRIRTTAPAEPEKIADLPQPDFDGLPLDRYLVAQPVLPLLSSRGCYHGRCAFCNVGYGGDQTYRQLDADQVVDQMMALQARYGTRHLFFADEAISPRNLRDISARLEARGTPIHWCGCARLEQALSGELLDRMARGGCRMLLFGLESASEPIMRRIDKGTQLEHMSRILEESARSGIWNHVFFFFGFPGETIDDAQETVNFVYQHQRAIHSASPGTFVLERYAPVHRSPQRYGIQRIVRRPEKDLAIYFDYQVEAGMDDAMAERLVDHLIQALPEKRFGHFYANDTYRFLYASHLREQGKPPPPWLVPDGQDVAAEPART